MPKNNASIQPAMYLSSNSPMNRDIRHLCAASTALWIKYRECNRVDGTYGHCIRRRQTPQGSPSMRVDGPTSDVPSASVMSPDPLQTFGERRQLERWEEDKVKLKELTSRATDTLTEMSESTVDALLVNLENLKAKIVEHRNKERKQFDTKPEAES